jgi:hypothetical protein
MSLLQHDPRTIERTFHLLGRGGTEIRIPKTLRAGTIAGYFDDPQLLIKELARLNETGPAIYITLNRINPALLARAYNHFKTRVETTTSDRDILQRRWLPVDVDPVRPAGISASDQEHEAALARCLEIRFELSAIGWSQPVRGDSSNGGHLLYPIDLPNDESFR